MNDLLEFLWDCIKGLFRGIFWLGTLLFEFLPWLWNGSEEDDATWEGRFIRLLMTLAGGVLIGCCLCLLNWAAQPKLSVLEKIDAIQVSFDRLAINRKTLINDLKQHPLEKRVEVPSHLRKRFLILTDDQLNKIDAAYLAEIKKLEVGLQNAKYRKRAEGIASRIQSVMERKPSGTVYLLDTDEFQAFCLSGGSIMITKGLMDQLSDDDELAFVIGHEYAHFLCRHTGESITKGMIAQEFGETFFFEEKPENAGNSLKASFAKLGYHYGVLIGVLLPYSRTMEYEADRLGVLLMKRAGFNVQGSFKAMERIAAMDQDSSAVSHFLSTHPKGEKRLDEIREAAALLETSDTPVWGSKLTVATESVKVAAIKKWLAAREKKAVPPAEENTMNQTDKLKEKLMNTKNAAADTADKLKEKLMNTKNADTDAAEDSDRQKQK